MDFLGALYGIVLRVSLPGVPVGVSYVRLFGVSDILRMDFLRVRFLFCVGPSRRTARSTRSCSIGLPGILVASTLVCYLCISGCTLVICFLSISGCTLVICFLAITAFVRVGFPDSFIGTLGIGFLSITAFVRVGFLSVPSGILIVYSLGITAFFDVELPGIFVASTLVCYLCISGFTLVICFLAITAFVRIRFLNIFIGTLFI